MQAKKSFWGKKPGFDIGDVLHIGVNIIFAGMIYAMVVYWDLVLLAVILILLSKWRVLAVQPRFWIPNIKANLIDVIVGISTVTLIDSADQHWVALSWVVLYVGWLLFLKPREHDVLVGAQALWGQLLGMIAIFTLPSFVQSPLLACAALWLVAASAARHFFTNYEEPHYRSLSLIWGLLAAQFGWVSLHWIQYYILFDVKIALYAVVITVMTASAGSIYHAYKKNSLQKGVVLENLLFAGALLAVIVATASWSAQL